MSMIFVDRESAYPNRYRVIPETGEAYYVVLERADEPITPGTPLNAETFNGMRKEIDTDLTFHSDNKDNPHEVTPTQIGALSTQGGRVTGKVFFERELKAHSFPVNSAKDGYVRVARITVFGTWANEQICFTAGCRSGISDVKMKFENNDHPDIGLEYFYSTGPSHHYIHNVSAGVWDVYLAVAPYDFVTIYDFRFSDYMSSNMSWEWCSDFVLSVPSDARVSDTTNLNLGARFLTTTGYEYETPPMELGVEYRTTKRYKGVAVYEKVDTNGNILWRSENETSWHLLTSVDYVATATVE